MSSSTGLHSLATIIKRLEAATARVEDLAHASFWPATVSDQAGPSDALPSPIRAIPPPAAVAPVPPPEPEVPSSVVAFDEQVVVGKLKPFVKLTKSFASKATVELVGLVEKHFDELRLILLTAASCQKPDTTTLTTLITDLQKTIETITRIKEDNRKDRDWFNHLAVLADGAPALGWVVVMAPGPYVAQTKEAVDYYGNRIMKEFKEKDPKHVEWVRAYTALLEELRKYVIEYHKTGLTWNPKGVSVSEFMKQSKPVGAPPPPPPPPPPPAAAPPPASQSGLTGTAAVFAELNKGEAVTKGLRKVDKSEMTHKNPALRASSVVPSSSGTGFKKPVKPAKPQALMGKKPSKLALEGKSWAVEYYEDDHSLVLDDVQINQAVNIFGCKNTVIQIKGKVNAVTLVNCTKTSVLVDSVVATVSVTKSPSFTLQITGAAPMIQLDSTDSGQIYLSKTSLGVEITSAKCSAINVSLPVEGEEDGVFEEQAVPEMLKTVIQKGKLVTSVVEHSG